MDQHALQAQGVGDETGVLAAGAAKAVEHIIGHVIAALDRDGLDRGCHVGDRDPDGAFRDLLRLSPIADLGSKSREGLAHGPRIERLILSWPEDGREEARVELAHHDIGIGDGQRALAAVAKGSGIGAGGLRPHAEPRAVEMKDRAAARGNGVDQHHRRADAYPRHHALEGPLIGAVVMADIGGGAAHVEADDLGEACQVCRLHRAHDAAGRPRQNRVLALEQRGGSEPTRGLHEEEVGYGSAACSPSPTRGERGVCG